MTIHIILAAVCATFGIVNLVLAINGLIKGYSSAWMNVVATIMCVLATCANVIRITF